MEEELRRNTEPLVQSPGPETQEAKEAYLRGQGLRSSVMARPDSWQTGPSTLQAMLDATLDSETGPPAFTTQDVDQHATSQDLPGLGLGWQAAEPESSQVTQQEDLEEDTATVAHGRPVWHCQVLGETRAPSPGDLGDGSA